MTTVDPFKLPKRMTRSQLEYWLLFSVCVANKSAKQTEIKVKALLEDMHKAYKIQKSPFELVDLAERNGTLLHFLTKHKVGQYRRIYKAFVELIDLDLDKLSVEMLEKVHGIGSKTARMVMLYYDPTCEAVPLDTHVLKYLAKMGVKNVPKSTPSAGKNYERLERAFQEIARDLGKTVRELDTEVWLSYAKR